MFYQYNPYKNTWGSIHWGHAISKDLVHWEYLPIALKPDELGMIFSGSCVVDWNNSSSFFKEGEGLIAIYTNALSVDKFDSTIQQQSIAYSEDDIGLWWNKYVFNPVIPNVEFKDFRDPKVIWHRQTGRWVMVLACGDRVKFYESQDLKQWRYLSEFGMNEGAHGGVFECPDLFELPVEGDINTTKWVLKVDINKGAIAGGSGGQYYIGHFDGTNFKNYNSPEKVFWIDYGKDFYAAQTFFNLHSERIVWIAWMNNWQYATKIPTEGWRGIFAIPRELKLRKVKDEVRLFQEPISELESLRISETELRNLNLHETASVCLYRGKDNDELNVFEVIGEFEIQDAVEFGFNIYKRDKQKTVIGYKVNDKKVFVDRRKSGRVDFSEKFPVLQEGSLECFNNKIKIRMFIDVSSVEVFFNDGEIVITSLIFPKKIDCNIEVYTRGGGVIINALNIYTLNYHHL